MRVDLTPGESQSKGLSLQQNSGGGRLSLRPVEIETPEKGSGNPLKIGRKAELVDLAQFGEGEAIDHARPPETTEAEVGTFRDQDRDPGVEEIGSLGHALLEEE